MKIAIDASQIVYKGTGVANYTVNLISNLLKIDQENEYVIFGTTLRQRTILQKYFSGLRKLNKSAVFKILPLPQTFTNFFWNKLHLINLEYFIGKFDLLHSSDWIQPKTSARKVTTVHDLVIYKYPEYSHPYIIETQKRRLTWVKKEVDLVIADSLATKKDLQEILHFEEKKIEVIYPGIGEEFIPREEREIGKMRQKYGLFDEYILTVGTMEPRKNLKTTLNSFQNFLNHPLLSTKKRPVELVVVGKAGWGERAKSNKYVHSLGYVKQQDLPALYSGAALFLYPSLYEGFGLPVLEAMACGCPVITTARGSLKEVAGEAALLIDPQMEEDLTIKITQLFFDAQLRSKLVEKGKIQAKRFTWEEAARKTLILYQKIISY